MIYTRTLCSRNTGKPGVLRKTKIGQEVKGIPKIWVDKQDDPFYNSILLNKYPYFFKYRYKKARDDYKKYQEECGAECKFKFRMSLDELLSLTSRTEVQEEFLSNYYKYMPLVYSDSPMNLLCRHIESQRFDILEKVKDGSHFDHVVLYHPDHPFTENEYASVVTILKEFRSIAKTISIQKDVYGADASVDFYDYGRYRVSCDKYMEEMVSKIGDIHLVANCLVRYFYEEDPKSNKELLWSLAGPQLFEAVKANSGTSTVMFPFSDPEGDIHYLNNRYSMQEVVLT